MADVVKMKSDIAIAEHPNETVIDILEMLLTRARNGDIQAIGYACVVSRDRLPMTGYEADGAFKLELATATGLLNYRVLQAIIDQM